MVDSRMVNSGYPLLPGKVISIDRTLVKAGINGKRSNSNEVNR